MYTVTDVQDRKENKSIGKSSFCSVLFYLVDLLCGISKARLLTYFFLPLHASYSISPLLYFTPTKRIPGTGYYQREDPHLLSAGEIVRRNDDPRHKIAVRSTSSSSISLFS